MPHQSHILKAQGNDTTRRDRVLNFLETPIINCSALLSYTTSTKVSLSPPHVVPEASGRSTARCPGRLLGPVAAQLLPRRVPLPRSDLRVGLLSSAVSVSCRRLVMLNVLGTPSSGRGATAGGRSVGVDVDLYKIIRCKQISVQFKLHQEATRGQISLFTMWTLDVQGIPYVYVTDSS